MVVAECSLVCRVDEMPKARAHGFVEDWILAEGLVEKRVSGQ
jgi:hypothetical protein